MSYFRVLNANDFTYTVFSFITQLLPRKVGIQQHGEKPYRWLSSRSNKLWNLKNLNFKKLCLIYVLAKSPIISCIISSFKEENRKSSHQIFDISAQKNCYKRYFVISSGTNSPQQCFVAYVLSIRIRVWIIDSQVFEFLHGIALHCRNDFVSIYFELLPRSIIVIMGWVGSKTTCHLTQLREKLCFHCSDACDKMK